MTYVCRLMHTSNKMTTDDDVYDVNMASSSYLYAFGEFSRRRNRRSRPRRFCGVHDVLRSRDDLNNMPDSYRNFSWTGSTDLYFMMSLSTKQFDYVLELVGLRPHILHLPTVHCGCVRAGTYDVVRRRTWSYDVIRRAQCECRFIVSRSLPFCRPL